MRRPPRPTFFPYTTLFRSHAAQATPRLGADGFHLTIEHRLELLGCDRGLPLLVQQVGHEVAEVDEQLDVECRVDEPGLGDRKSTRLNSSHANISYAVFCLK